ncbi:MAG: BLUF domain-containing protein [Burkholderiaceae bacterium]
MLVRLMYASRPTSPGRPEDLAAILRASRNHNPGAGITGLLCCSSEVFLQVLEGGRHPVNRLYHRIATDPRHQDPILLRYDEIDERSFAGWAMGQIDLARLNTALLLKYSESPVLDPYAVSGKVSLALFDELVATASVNCQG